MRAIARAFGFARWPRLPTAARSSSDMALPMRF